MEVHQVPCVRQPHRCLALDLRVRRPVAAVYGSLPLAVHQRHGPQPLASRSDPAAACRRDALQRAHRA